MSRFNSDDRRRAAERAATASGDPREQMKVLVERLRAGEVDPLRLEVAAALGHPIARAVLGDAAPDVMNLGYDRGLHAAVVLAGPCIAVAWAADSLERMPLDNNAYKNVIAGARALASHGSIPAETSEAVRDAAFRATEEAIPFSIAKSLTDAACSLGAAFAWFNLEENTYNTPYYMATQACGAVGGVCASAYRAADPFPVGEAGSETPRRKQAYNAEKQWAMERLAEYLLGERSVECSAPGDGGAEWVRIREEKAKEDTNADRLIDEILEERRKQENPARRNSDDHVRQLERQWLADPDDLETRETFFRELRRIGRGDEIEQILIEAERRKPPLPVVIRAWESPAEQRRRLRAGERIRLWIRPYSSTAMDLAAAENALRVAGARIAPRSRMWGMSNQPEVVVFSGLDERAAVQALDTSGTEFAGVHPKTWGGDAAPEHRSSPDLILMFPTEPCAPPDDCDSIMWTNGRLADYGCANYQAVVGRTRAATPEEYIDAVRAYEAENGRRLRVYVRSSYEFDRTRREAMRRHGY